VASKSEIKLKQRNNQRAWGNGVQIGLAADQPAAHQMSMFESVPTALVTRVKLFLVLVIYISGFLWVYETWGSVNWWYLGLQSNGRPQELYFGITLAIFSIFVLPTESKKYSDFFVCLLFWSSVLPTYLVIGSQGYEGVNSYQLNSFLFLALILIAKIPKFLVFSETMKMRRFKILDRGLIPFITAIYLMLLGAFYYTYKDILSFADVDTIYDQRALFAQTEVSIFFLYLLGWLSTVLNPYFIFYGLFDRSKLWMLPLGLIGQILIYMAFAGKSFILALFVYFLFYWFLQKKGRLLLHRISYVYLSFVMVSVITVYISNGAIEGNFSNVPALIYMRGLALPAALTGVYAQYFSFNPYTYFSQMNVVNLFVEYPYPESLGLVVGRFLNNGSIGMNANASMWATDGLSSLGPIGIIVIGGIVGIALSFANRLVTPERLQFASLVSTTFILNLGDSGFFTNLVTGGGLVVMLIAFGSPNVRQFNFNFKKPVERARARP
jgi:hypothetical protein